RTAKLRWQCHLSQLPCQTASIWPAPTPESCGRARLAHDPAWRSKLENPLSSPFWFPRGSGIAGSFPSVPIYALPKIEAGDGRDGVCGGRPLRIEAGDGRDGACGNCCRRKGNGSPNTRNPCQTMIGSRPRLSPERGTSNAVTPSCLRTWA